MIAFYRKRDCCAGARGDLRGAAEQHRSPAYWDGLLKQRDKAALETALEEMARLFDQRRTFTTRRILDTSGNFTSTSSVIHQTKTFAFQSL